MFPNCIVYAYFVTVNQKRITNQILNKRITLLNSTLNYLFNISNMKKLFSYLLISSMVVLSSCTNYDDQFDDLNSQINSLKSQIEGFSSLSSGLTALQGTVSGLQAAVAALPQTATPATDISGLEAAVAELQAALSGAATSAEVAALTADLAATQTALEATIATNATDVSDLEAAAADNATDVEALAASLETLSETIAGIVADLASVSTAEEVSALASSLAAAQADLDVLLAQSSFYSTDVSITTVAELEFATSLGDKLNVVNANVTITQSEEMDATALQAAMAKMLTVTGNVVYTSTATTTTKGSFTNLKSAGSLTINQASDNVSLPNFATTAGALSITAQDETSLTISLPKLTQAGTFTLAAAKATTFSAPIFAAYDGDLTINIDDSGSIDLSAFTYSVTEAGVAAKTTAHTLTVNANTLTAPVFKIGKIIGTEVDNVSLPVWEGTSTSRFVDASTVVLPKVTAYGGDLAMDLTTMFPDAQSVHIVGNSSTSTASTPVTTEVSVDAETHTKLETLILDGTFSSIDLKDDQDLVTLTIDVTAEDFTLDNSDVVTADVTLTAAAATSTGKTSVSVINNTKLDSFTMNDVAALNELNIYSNSDLTAISFPDLDASSGTLPNAMIYSNDLKATMTETAVSATVSTYETTGTSGIQNLQDFLDDVITKRDGEVRMTVKIDELTSVDDEGNVTGPSAYTVVDLLDADVTQGTDAIAQTKAWVLNNNGTKTVQITVDGDALFRNSANTATPLALSSNMDLAVTELKTAAARASDLGLTLDAQVGSNVADFDIVFKATTNSATFEDSSATATTTRLDASDIITLEIGPSQSVTTTVTAGSASTTTGIASALAAAWTSKYGTASTLYTLSGDAVSGTLRISVSDFSGNRAHNHAVSVSVANDTGVNSGTTPLISYIAGATKATTDNKLKGVDVILTLTDKNAGVTGVTYPTVALSGTTSAIALGTTLDYTASTADNYKSNAWPTEARGIVIPAKDSVSAVENSAAVAVDNTAKL